MHTLSRCFRYDILLVAAAFTQAGWPYRVSQNRGLVVLPARRSAEPAVPTAASRIRDPAPTAWRLEAGVWRAGSDIDASSSAREFRVRGWHLWDCT